MYDRMPARYHGRRRRPSRPSRGTIAAFPPSRPPTRPPCPWPPPYLDMTSARKTMAVAKMTVGVASAATPQPNFLITKRPRSIIVSVTMPVSTR